VGHLFQGRYHAILVQKEAYLLELGRYLVLNPVRANMVMAPGEWPWSSYSQMLRSTEAPAWLDTDWVLSQFSLTRSKAVAAYKTFVFEGIGLGSPLLKVSHQLILGDAAFVEQYRVLASEVPLQNISRAQRKSAALTLDEYRKKYPDRDEAIARAYLSTLFTMAQIGEFFKVSLRTVYRAVLKFERTGNMA
jgi:putative transposase